MNNNFISQFDPTTPLDLSQITLQQQYTKLTEKEKIMIGAKFLGMDHVPVDISTFINDEYYLGNELITNKGSQIFDFWKNKLKQIFPDPINNPYPYISFGGSIGSGKSTISKIMGLYQFHKLDCCRNIFTSLGLAGGSKIAFGFFHASYDTAYKDFVQYYKYVFDISPYFKNLYNNPPIRLIASGPKATGSVLGTQLIYTVLSELGFWKPQDAIDKMNEVLIRYQSRFVDKRFNFGAIIADSSAKDAEFGASQKFEESVPENELFKISPAHWQVRPEKYKESKGKTFQVYRGDSKRQPFIVDSPEDVKRLELDPDRLVDVPVQLKFNFRNDIVRSLNDLAGIPYSSKDLFFGGDISHVLSCSSIKNLIPDLIYVDFYDTHDTIYDKVAPMLMRVPRHTHLFLHYDIGLKKDICGIAICYYNGERIDLDGYSKSSYPKFKIPLVVGLSRKKGQSTSLDHLLKFIQQLSKDYIVTFSADTFASAGIFQGCERFGIDYSTISIDKTTDAAFMFKNCINTDRIEMPYCDRLLRECSEVRITTNGKNGDHVKIDHPLVSSCYDFDYKDRNKDQALPGTKDLFDACCGAVYSCYLKYADYSESTSGVSKMTKAISQMTKNPREESAKQIQDMLENIF